MFAARLLTRSAPKQLVLKPSATLSLKNVASLRSFQSSARLFTPPPPEDVHERRIPVTHYNKGVREQEILEVNDKDEGPVSSAVQDEKSVAQPLNPEVIPHLTPTLARFTLQDRVAIVTG